MLFVFICHIEQDYNYKKIQKMCEEMPRMPKGNYEGYVNQASSITIFQRWHKNYGDGYKILLDGINIKEVYRC